MTSISRYIIIIIKNVAESSYLFLLDVKQLRMRQNFAIVET